MQAAALGELQRRRCAATGSALMRRPKSRPPQPLPRWLQQLCRQGLLVPVVVRETWVQNAPLRYSPPRQSRPRGWSLVILAPEMRSPEAEADWATRPALSQPAAVNPSRKTAAHPAVRMWTPCNPHSLTTVRSSLVMPSENCTKAPEAQMAAPWESTNASPPSPRSALSAATPESARPAA